MANAQDHLNDWLRDAHAMEEQAEKMLTSTASRIENYPEFKAKLESHAEDSRQQAAMLKACIDRRGAGTSAVKDMAGRLTAMAQGMSGLFVSDEIVKAAMACYTFKHMEIASYRSLVAAAETVGDTETAQVCQRILTQEEAVAGWFAQEIPSVTRRFLTRADTPGATAKH